MTSKSQEQPRSNCTCQILYHEPENYFVSCKERIYRYPYTTEFWRVSKEWRNGTDDDLVSSQVARTWSINIMSYQEYWLRFVCWNSEKFKALYDDNYILWYNSVHLLSTLHPTHLDGTLLTRPEPDTLIVFGNRRINNPSCAPSLRRSSHL